MKWKKINNRILTPEIDYINLYPIKWNNWMKSSYLSKWRLFNNFVKIETSVLVDWVPEGGGLWISSLCNVCNTAWFNRLISSMFRKPGRSRIQQIYCYLIFMSTCSQKWVYSKNVLLKDTNLLVEECMRNRVTMPFQKAAFQLCS